jgi:hypothetical protein
LLPTSTLPKVMLLRLAERTAGLPAGPFALVRPAQPERLRIIGTVAKTSKRTSALDLPRYALASSEHTRNSLNIRSYLSGLKAALAEELRGQVVVAALSGPNFYISSYDHTRRRNRS